MAVFWTDAQLQKLARVVTGAEQDTDQDVIRYVSGIIERIMIYLGSDLSLKNLQRFVKERMSGELALHAWSEIHANMPSRLTMVNDNAAIPLAAASLIEYVAVEVFDVSGPTPKLPHVKEVIASDKDLSALIAAVAAPPPVRVKAKIRLPIEPEAVGAKTKSAIKKSQQPE